MQDIKGIHCLVTQSNQGVLPKQHLPHLGSQISLKRHPWRSKIIHMCGWLDTQKCLLKGKEAVLFSKELNAIC